MSRIEPDSVGPLLSQALQRAIAEAGGWLPFERFMEIALYAPSLGYYSRSDRQFGLLPGSGSDFVTAPELSPLFGRALARQLVQVLDATATDTVWEFGAGSGALAAQLLDALGERVRRYAIVDLSGALAARQRETLQRFGDKVQWLQSLPESIEGVVVGNEVLDAMPVQLISFDGERWHERGVVVQDGGFAWSDRPTDARPPVDAGFAPGTVTELPRQASGFAATLAERLGHGAALLIDYGFPEAEYYLPQRIGGTLMCHRGHRADTDPLSDVGLKDITSHVDFTAVALSAQQAGCEVMGYTTQAHFLINCGVLDDLRDADARTLANAQKLLAEHEMGELFKVLAFGRGVDVPLLGFTRGDRLHRL
jgi:SAM-dependent MidA family methyltransferase